MIQEQQYEEHNFKIDQFPSKAMKGFTKTRITRLIALTIISAATLLIFITTGTVFYNHHHHRQLIDNSISKELQSTTTTGLSTSAGPIMISTSSNSIPYAERQALSDLHDTTDGSKRNYVPSSAGAQWSFDQPLENPWANQAVSHVKGIL